jgi:hypothetical protein
MIIHNESEIVHIISDISEKERYMLVSQYNQYSQVSYSLQFQCVYRKALQEYFHNTNLSSFQNCQNEDSTCHGYTLS